LEKLTMNSPRIPEQAINPPEIPLGIDEVSQDELDVAVGRYDNADYACALIEYDAAQQGATDILVMVLEFCDKLRNISVISCGGVLLDLRDIRLAAVKSAEAQAYAMIERGEL
jgi:hypothetical protein